jgi:hypothetical protein
LLLVKNDESNDARDRLVWKWIKGDATPKEAYGDPLPPPYTLCLYEDGAAVVEAQIPGAAECPACWKETAKGF